MQLICNSDLLSKLVHRVRVLYRSEEWKEELGVDYLARDFLGIYPISVDIFEYLPYHDVSANLNQVFEFPIPNHNVLTKTTVFQLLKLLLWVAENIKNTIMIWLVGRGPKASMESKKDFFFTSNASKATEQML